MVGIRMRHLAFFLLLPVLVSCQSATGSGEQQVGELIEKSERQIPPGAIQTGEDFYMVPAGTNSHGCARFTPWSKYQMAPAAIYYRNAEGDFVLYDSLADCGAGS